MWPQCPVNLAQYFSSPKVIRAFAAIFTSSKISADSAKSEDCGGQDCRAFHSILGLPSKIFN